MRSWMTALWWMTVGQSIIVFDASENQSDFINIIILLKTSNKQISKQLVVAVNVEVTVAVHVHVTVTVTVNVSLGLPSFLPLFVCFAHLSLLHSSFLLVLMKDLPLDCHGFDHAVSVCGNSTVVVRRSLVLER